MGPVSLRHRGKADQAKGEKLPSRRLGEPSVLLALAAILLGNVWLALLLDGRLPSGGAAPVSSGAESAGADDTPGDDSAEAGFARDMAIHHAQAVRMAEVVRDRTLDPAVRVIATDVVLTQQAEIGQMRGWLEVWGLTAGQSGPAMAWMGHPTQGAMPGMASPKDLALLQQAPPEEADAQFLRLMIPHHQAAVEMAEAALDLSNQPEITRFARRTVTTQQAEINGMQALLQRKGLPPVEVETSPTAHSEAPEKGAPPAQPEGGADEEAHSHGGEGSGEAHGTGHAGDSAGPYATFRDVARLSPLPLAALAAAWLSLDALRRRRVGHVEAASPLALQSAAVVALSVSAVLHVGLFPAHLLESTAHGVFFAVAGVVLAGTAAAVMAWPSRPAYVAGACSALVLVLLWALFRFVPPPGAASAEVVDLAGLIAKAAELAAAGACAALWLASRRHGARDDAARLA